MWRSDVSTIQPQRHCRGGLTHLRQCGEHYFAYDWHEDASHRKSTAAVTANSRDSGDDAVRADCGRTEGRLVLLGAQGRTLFGAVTCEMYTNQGRSWGGESARVRYVADGTGKRRAVQTIIPSHSLFTLPTSRTFRFWAAQPSSIVSTPAFRHQEVGPRPCSDIEHW